MKDLTEVLMILGVFFVVAFAWTVVGYGIFMMLNPCVC